MQTHKLIRWLKYGCTHCGLVSRWVHVRSGSCSKEADNPSAHHPSLASLTSQQHPQTTKGIKFPAFKASV